MDDNTLGNETGVDVHLLEGGPWKSHGDPGSHERQTPRRHGKVLSKFSSENRSHFSLIFSTHKGGVVYLSIILSSVVKVN